MTNYRYDYDNWEIDRHVIEGEQTHQEKLEAIESKKLEEGKPPRHYDTSCIKIQPLEYIIANNLDFLEGNIVKYVTRYPNKGGVDDLIKARNYIDRLIERERA